MPKGIDIHDVTIGSGEEALRGKTVVVNVRMFLNHGEEVIGAFHGGPKIKIDLGKREYIPGLIRGIEGMHVGGYRTIVIGPHLAYGEKGLEGRVPPNALLRCEVELLEIREPGVRKPEDYPPGKFLHVFHPGEAARNQPRWQLGLHEDGHCGVLLNIPIPEMTWRHTRKRSAEWHLDHETTAALFQEVIDLPVQFPIDCLKNEELWADSSEPANSITRDRKSDKPCVTFGIYEKGQHLGYSLIETSQVLLKSKIYIKLMDLLAPFLNQDSDTAR
jgi:hypothetical protein